MSSLASFLMVASGILCLTGALASKGQAAIIAAAMMVLAMVDLAYTDLIPPVIWSGALLVVGLCLAVFLRSSSSISSSPRRSPALVASGVGGVPESGADRGLQSSAAPERSGPGASHPGPTAAVLSAIAYPVMAWQVLNHGAHMSGATHAGGHGHHAGDVSLISTFLTIAVVVLAILLVICAVQDIVRKRPLVSLDCWGMAAMIVVMQFLH